MLNAWGSAPRPAPAEPPASAADAPAPDAASAPVSTGSNWEEEWDMDFFPTEQLEEDDESASGAEMCFGDEVVVAVAAAESPEASSSPHSRRRRRRSRRKRALVSSYADLSSPDTNLSPDEDLSRSVFLRCLSEDSALLRGTALRQMRLRPKEYQ